MAHGKELYSNQPRSNMVEGISFERASPGDKAHPTPCPGLGLGGAEGLEGLRVMSSSVFRGDS